MSLEFLQEYWWLLISILGAALVFLLFVQGGQSMILNMPKNTKEKMIDTLARRWELTFTTLVVFGGAFFASFPLFYSTSFGGAYWVWMIILFSFVLQAVSYKYRNKDGNMLGQKTYDIFLFINGIVAPIFLGAAVSTFFFGSDFTIEKGNIMTASTISQWGTWHGLEALTDWRIVTFGLMTLFLTRTLANMWFINQVEDEDAWLWNRKQLIINAALFVVLFLITVAALLLADGYQTISEHEFNVIPNKYCYNLFSSYVALAFFLIGTVLVLLSVIQVLMRKAIKSSIWIGGLGTIMVVLALFWIAGYNNTPYYPSYADISSSLTIYNSSSSHFTLQTMFYVSLFIPIVLAYISYVWRKLHK